MRKLSNKEKFEQIFDSENVVGDLIDNYLEPIDAALDKLPLEYEPENFDSLRYSVQRVKYLYEELSSWSGVLMQRDIKSDYEGRSADALLSKANKYCRQICNQLRDIAGEIVALNNSNCPEMVLGLVKSALAPVFQAEAHLANNHGCHNPGFAAQATWVGACLAGIYYTLTADPEFIKEHSSPVFQYGSSAAMAAAALGFSYLMATGLNPAWNKTKEADISR